MKSKANVKGHPLHPILVVFPIAFFTGTLLFDLLGFIYNKSSFLITGEYLEAAGIVSGLLAAVPGVVDFVYTVPPRSTAKARATNHALINVTALFVFGVALMMRQKEFYFLILVVELCGVILLGIGGWMGGTLVHRNQIGVDVRYAHAGRWKEAYFKTTDNYFMVAAEGELKVNQMKLLHIGSKRIVLGRTENGYRAFGDHCTHRGGSLAAGTMICGTVQCPWHGSQFSVETGEVKAGPAQDKILTYKVTEKEGKIYLEL